MHRYIDAWNETDAGRRRELVAGRGATTALTSTRSCRARATTSIAAMIGGAQQQFPGHRFELSFGPDAHNDQVRFAWRLYGPEATRRSPPASTSARSPRTAGCAR